MTSPTRTNLASNSIKRQHGVGTLIFSLLILILATMVVLYSSNFARQEQKLANSNERSKLAFEAAEAGLAAAFAYIENGSDRDDDGVVDPIFDTDADGVGVNSSSSVGNGSVTVSTTQNGNEITVVSTGFSDDRSATHFVSQSINPLDALPNDPDNPLTTKGSVAINGSATVHNQEGHSTIWSGNTIALGSNNSTATNVPDIGDSGYPLCMDTSLTCTTVSSSNKVAVGLDVIENDTSLGNLTASEMFLNYFGLTPNLYRSSMVTIESTPANADSDVQLATNEVIWIEGDTTFVNNTTVGCSVVVNGGALCSSANRKPSIVIVNGNAIFKGTPNFSGFLYVTGNATVVGNLTVVGSVAVAGVLASDAGGSMDIWYSSDTLDDLKGPAVGSAGTWKDF